MCDCYKIGGPWIAEDPDCPVHGTEARMRDEKKIELSKRVRDATDISELKDILLEILDL